MRPTIAAFLLLTACGGPEPSSSHSQDTGGAAGAAGVSSGSGGSGGTSGGPADASGGQAGSAGESSTSSDGIWISAAELAALPIGGEAWDAIVETANGSWGAPDLSDYAGLAHSQGVYAGALVAVRLSTEPAQAEQAQAMRDKTLKALDEVIGTEAAALPSSNGGKDDGSLAIARQLLRYVIAADLLGLKENWGKQYQGAASYAEYMIKTPFTFRVDDGGQRLCDNLSSSNGGSMARASCIALARYLGDDEELDRMWNAYRRFVGDTSAPDLITFSGTGENWHHDDSAKLGINPKGTTCAGSSYPADGVIPNDQGRGGICPSNPDSEPGYTQYPWEGLQGLYAQAVMLARTGGKDNPWQLGDQAPLRALTYQWSLQTKFGGEWYDASRAAWVKHLAKVVYGYQPRDYAPSDGGRNMAFTQWTHRNAP